MHAQNCTTFGLRARETFSVASFREVISVHVSLEYQCALVYTKRISCFASGVRTSKQPQTSFGLYRCVIKVICLKEFVGSDSDKVD